MNAPVPRISLVHRAFLSLAAGAAVAACSLSSRPVLAAEPPECLLPDPAKWPAPAKPYFMIAFDTSGSMAAAINPASNNSCGYPNTRTGHGSCAVKNTVMAYAGQANFGLASYARTMSGCSGSACYAGCTYGNLPNNSDPIQCDNGGCGPEPSPVGGSLTRAGANILVPMLKDTFAPPPPSNVPELLSWVDNDCTNSKELFADGCTPLNGILRDMFRYYSAGWTFPGGVTYPSPLTSIANGERACRSVNVILVTDGDESCDNQVDAIASAQALLTGFTANGLAWSVKTYVINFAGGIQANADAIAAAGGTGTSYFATNETQLALAFSNIIGGSIKPETCDNADNNCNGCTDEGFNHYCNSQPTAGSCCSWTTPLQRAGCLNTYRSSITAAAPQGNLALLPCTTAAQSTDPTSWLCYDPGEKCDNVDNNCSAGADEGITKCGSPLACPKAETCNGQDDNCDGLIDEGGVCPNACSPSAEVCDGCDNNCNGMTDDGIAGIPCGLTGPGEPSWCAGTITCKAPQAVAAGACVAGGGFSACNTVPKTEACNGLDDNCNGIIDDGVTSAACVPAGAPPGLNYGANSACKLGQSGCINGMTTCDGWIGPSVEVCDGLDNDCDGTVDDGVPGLGQPCGVNQLPCKAGATACVSGAIVCQGATGPQPEICDGVDNNCNGVIDDAPLSDAPAANGCWTLPGNCCSFSSLTWCPPAGANCNDNGTLSPPCNKGLLTCSGAAGWVCQNAKGPSAEVCDGIDNDCDNLTDEAGPSPGGIDGSDNPFPPPAAKIGDVCGVSGGACQQGLYACVSGAFTCVGAQAPVAEACDCVDNDCDGAIDNDNPGGSPVCGTSQTCVKGSSGSCQCAAPCGSGEFKCPFGQICEQGVTSSQTGQSLPGGFCVIDPATACGDCASKTVKDASDKVTCAPAGTVLDNCVTPPVCTCKQDACDAPCAGVTCGAGTACTSYGAKAGTCVPANCWNQPCEGCGKACNGGTCIDSPCQADTCPAGQECKPNADFSDHTCVGSCAGKVCNAGEICASGACVADCSPACAATETCDRTKAPPSCVPNLCTPTSCADGSCCDPVTGACGNCPCAGVRCPEGQACAAATGECAAVVQTSTGSSTGAGGSTSATTSTGTTGSTSTSTGAGGSGGGSRGVFGLATGGGGCSCEVGPRPGSDGAARWALAALAAAVMGARRRRSSAARAAKEVL